MRTATVELEVHKETDSILLGYVVGTFRTDTYEGDVVASGKKLRVHVKGYKGFVDIDMTTAVNHAVMQIISNHELTR